MAKQKIKTINGKRLVVGNVNELTSNEILVSVYNGQVLLKERDDNGLIKIISTADDFSGGSDSLKEGDIIYYSLKTTIIKDLYLLKDYIKEYALYQGESMNNGSLVALNRYVADTQMSFDSEQLLIYNRTHIVNTIYAIKFQVGSDLKTAEDIIGSDNISVITKEEYDNVFNL